MKKNKDAAISDAKVAIDACSITRIEQARLEELERQIAVITDRISEMSSRESSTNDAIYDATIRHLMYEQEIFQTECDGLNKNKQESLYLENQLKVLLKYLDDLKGPLENAKFKSDLFAKILERGILYNNHQISFELKCGISRKIENIIKR